jgi:hypothetical protein
MARAVGEHNESVVEEIVYDSQEEQDQWPDSQPLDRIPSNAVVVPVPTPRLRTYSRQRKVRDSLSVRLTASISRTVRLLQQMTSCPNSIPPQNNHPQTRQNQRRNHRIQADMRIISQVQPPRTTILVKPHLMARMEHVPTKAELEIFSTLTRATMMSRSYLPVLVYARPPRLYLLPHLIMLLRYQRRTKKQTHHLVVHSELENQNSRCRIPST